MPVQASSLTLIQILTQTNSFKIKGFTMSTIINNWYVLMGDQKYGPYEYKTMIEMLQSHQLMDYNYAWASHMASWTQIHQIEEFSKDRFQLLLKEETELQTAFIPRQNKRVEVTAPILGHNNVRFFDGQVVSVSEAGALCLINSPLVQVGDKLKLHIKSGTNSSASFNVEAEVVRKNFSKNRLNSKSGLYYAVRFHDIQPVGLEQIQRWISG